MRVIRRDAKLPLDYKRDFSLRTAQEDDYDELIRGSFVLYEGGELKVVYLDLKDDLFCAPIFEQMQAALYRIKYSDTKRTGEGLWSKSRTFGYRPRITIRNDYCAATSLAVRSPEDHAAIAAGVEIVARFYREFNPDLYARHAAMTEAKARPEYRLEGGAYTSGIINSNNPLHYHFDKGNYRNVWSGMLGFKQDIDGGYLSMPEYRIAAEIGDRSLFLFDGQGILHGVTPIRLLSPDARRFTVVYYSLKAIWQCLSPGEEIARIQRKRVEREEKRLQERLVMADANA